MKPDPYADIIKNYVQKSKDEKKMTPQTLDTLQRPQSMMPMPQQSYGPSKASVDRACQMKEEMLKRLEILSQNLPPNTLDQLIDELGGPENVSEMTGRKGRIVQDEKGDVRYESRSEQDTPLETLNLTEKDRFMNGQKDVAIISEAASSGISLQVMRTKPFPAYKDKLVISSSSCEDLTAGLSFMALKALLHDPQSFFKFYT